MIVVFHENVLLLSTYKFFVITIAYRNFGNVCLWFSRKTNANRNLIGY